MKGSPEFRADGPGHEHTARTNHPNDEEAPADLEGTTQQGMTMTYSVEQARKIYAMGAFPAMEAGFDPWKALEIIQNAAQAERETKAETRKADLHVGMIVSDGRLGKIVAIDGNRVTLQGYLAKRSAHIGELHDWSYRPA